MSIQSVNPATGETLETFTPASPQDLERMVTRAHAAFLEWRAVPFAARADRMRDAARLLRKDIAYHAVTMTLEMGKPMVQAEAEVEKCAWACDFYAEHAESFLAEHPRKTDALTADSSAQGLTKRPRRFWLSRERIVSRPARRTSTAHFAPSMRRPVIAQSHVLSQPSHETTGSLVGSHDPCCFHDASFARLA